MLSGHRSLAAWLILLSACLLPAHWALSQCATGRCPTERRAPLVPVRPALAPPFAVLVRGGDRALATGIYVGTVQGQGVTLTCQHVIEDGAKSVAGRPATRSIVDKDGYDLAAVITVPLGISAAVIGPAVIIGQRVRLSGFARGRLAARIANTIGYRAVTNRRWNDLILGIPAIEGMSGGPIVDEYGQVVGMIWGTSGNETYAIPAPLLADFLARLKVTLGEKSQSELPPAEVNPVEETPLNPPAVTLPLVPSLTPFPVPPVIPPTVPAVATTPAVAPVPAEPPVIEDDGDASPFAGVLALAIPAILAGLGWTGPPAIAVVLGLRSLSAILRRRSIKRRIKPPDAEFPGGSLPRDDEEAAQFLQLSRLEGRSPLHDALIGRIAFDELDKTIDSKPNGSEADWARRLRRTLEDRFNSMAPPAVFKAA